MAFNSAAQAMEVAQQAGNTALFGLGLWLVCALVGVLVGAAVAAVQIFPGRWHPAWAVHLAYWFSCPLLAGLASGVVLALKNVPALSEARTFWLLLCMIITGFTALLAAAAFAYLTRDHESKAADKAKQMSRQRPSRGASRTEEWEDRVRSFFKPRTTPLQAQESPPDHGTRSRRSKQRKLIVPGQRAELPPERYPAEATPVKPPPYAGHPRGMRKTQGKFDEPIR